MGAIESPPGHRSGYVAIVGRPNAGKSTLMNALLGRRLSIVTSKPQTTRHRILGVLSESDYQIIFLDTPGVIEPRYGLQESMMRTVRRSIEEADLLLLIADATLQPHRESIDLLGGQPAILVLNKMDLIRSDEALPLVTTYSAIREFEEVVPISAKKGTNLELLRSVIVSRLPEGPPFYPADMITEHPERFFVAEMVREAIFNRFGKEVPYSTQVNIVSYAEPTEEGDKLLIDAEIVVERESQKAILIGRKGSAIKAVGTAARKSIELFLGRPVYLRLFVKVRKGWRDSETFLRSFGYDR